MFFLNLSAAEFFTLLGTLGGLVTALYLLDRAKRKKLVSTLQFWTHAQVTEVKQARRRMREPWSLVLQLTSLLLLLLAVSRVQWGNREHRGRDHVLLLDTSSWTAGPAADSARETVLEREELVAARFLQMLPPEDRVMLVAADSLATPLTGFTSARGQLHTALAGEEPSFTSLDIDGAISFAHQALGSSGGPAAEIVYVGPEMIEPRVSDDKLASGGSALRVIPVGVDRENCGIRQVTIRQSVEEPDLWQAFIRIRNFGRDSHTAALRTSFGRTAFAVRRIRIAPGSEMLAEYAFTTRDAGNFVAAIDPGGSLRSDDRVVLHLPRNDGVEIAIYTDRPERLRALVGADSRLKARFFRPSEYTPKPGANIVVLDRFVPPIAPGIPSLWIDPPKDRSPLPVKDTVTDSLVSWSVSSTIESAVRARKLRVPEATTFQTFEGDTALASVAAGAVVVLRPPNQTQGKMAVLGFDPAEGELRYEVVTPLLFATLVEWLDSEAFRPVDVSARQVGLSKLHLLQSEEGKGVSVLDAKGFPVPFTRSSHELQLFVGQPTTVNVRSKEREQTLSLTLPAVGSAEWNVPAGALIGMPAALRYSLPAIDLWKWLAIFGAVGLLLEWLLFGPRRRKSGQIRRASSAVAAKTSLRDEEREFIAR